MNCLRLLGNVGLSIFVVSACAPGLDWREVRPESSRALALFPCKPEVTRQSGMGLAQCKADGLNFALSWAEAPDPTQVGRALEMMRTSLASKVAGVSLAPLAIQVPGMTPNPQSLMQHLSGSAQQVDVAVFSRGSRVYQLVMLGAKGNAAAWDSFLKAVRLDVE